MPGPLKAEILPGLRTDGRGYRPHTPKPGHGHPFRAVLKSSPGKGELYQMTVDKASRALPAYPDFEQADILPMSSDLAAAYGPCQDRATEAVDWSGYGGEDD